MPDRPNPHYLRTIVLILLAAMTVYLIGNNSVSLWDRDEPRYAQASRQMLESGDWIVPKLLDEAREKKPIFIYWCQATAMKIFGVNSFAARLPSVIFVTATSILLAAVLWRTVGRRRALWTTLIFTTSALVIAAAKMSITDGVLLLFATAAQLCLYAIWRGRGNWPGFIVLGISLGFGILTKGPVVPAFMLATAITLLVMRLLTPLQRDGAKQGFSENAHGAAVGIMLMQWTACIAIAAVILAPWLIAIEQRSPGYILRTFQKEVVQRGTDAQEGHGGYPGFYLLTIWCTYLPWSIFLPATAVFAWRRRHLPHIRFALAAAIGPWIMLEIYVTKLPHYLLPVYPALAFLTAEMLLRSGKSLKLPAILGASMMVLVLIGYGLILPHISLLKISPRVAEVLIQQGAIHPGDAIMLGYKETSLAFYQGGTIRPVGDDRFLQTTPPSDWPRWIVVSDKVWADTPQPIKQQLDVLATIHGINLADRLKVMDVLVLRKR